MLTASENNQHPTLGLLCVTDLIITALNVKLISTK